MRKVFLVLLCIIFLQQNASAQKADSLIYKFQHSIVRNLKYPETLLKSCIATYTVLKADVDDNGTLKDLKLSDSADPLFNMEFVFIHDNIDKKALLEYIKIKRLKSISLMMPISYSVTDTNCKTPVLLINWLDRLFLFNKEKVRSEVVLLPILSRKLSIESIE